MKKVKITEEDLQIIQYYLKEANEYGLAVEVVAWALKSMKENSQISVSTAIALGASEWVK
jgi:hypothetical protein